MPNPEDRDKQAAQTLQLSIREVCLFLAKAAAILVFLDVAAAVFAVLADHDSVFGLLGLVDLDKERGIGMLFQVLLLLGNCALFALVARQSRNGSAPAGPWMLLSGIFFFLSLDEFAYIHERLMPVMRTLVNTDGFLHFAWIVPYAAAVAVLALYIGPRILKLDWNHQKFFWLAAIAYVGGALGLEAIGGWRLVQIGGEQARPEIVYELLTSIEETLEIVGLILLVRALLGIVYESRPNWAVRLSP